MKRQLVSTLLARPWLRWSTQNGIIGCNRAICSQIDDPLSRLHNSSAFNGTDSTSGTSILCFSVRIRLVSRNHGMSMWWTEMVMDPRDCSSSSFMIRLLAVCRGARTEILQRSILFHGGWIGSSQWWASRIAGLRITWKCSESETLCCDLRWRLSSLQCRYVALP